MTVTLGHSASGPGLVALARQADLLVAAIGRPETITAEWVKPGATVVDVGIHRVPANERGGTDRGMSGRNAGTSPATRLTGDVDAASVARVAGALTPVPGGVGPMTVASLIANTVVAASGALARIPR
jgi:methylenetetrahydrofolate dehydrogenase (NADP+) / methenyltetrahydrofolate cyclohydrolase